MSKNEVNGQVGQIQPEVPGLGQRMTEREQKAEIFWAQYPERYAERENTEVHPLIAGMMQN